MKMDELKEIVKLIEESKIDILKLEKGDFKLFYQKEGAKNIRLEGEESSFEEERNNFENSIQSDSTVEETDKDSDLHQITSPMIGAFYSRPNPDAEPFVEIGSKISKNDPVCVLEAMKLLNEVNSNVDGEIVDILAEDGQIIEFGQPLFTVRVSE
ncbi:acetyl-CoA carboxylase biotin carboxyl carrier protein [Pseudogracilibacillus sp. SE30717A]|uniref:acetyl-CoA carboxylase biotin carboxyl carrier protein n=1 Tax=Pseudogracilibacillus sp. SE30717A TaxID=3098293 RepID=UPI00300E3582